jgi:hypothetical protein
MKIEIEIEKNGKYKDKPGEMEKPELEDEQKMAIGKKLKKNLALTRMERNLLAAYLLSEEGEE